MKIIKIILVFLFIFTFVFTAGKVTVMATGYTAESIQTPENGWYYYNGTYYYSDPVGCAGMGCTGSPWQGPGTLAGYYYSDITGLYYPIGQPAAPAGTVGGGGSGPGDPGPGVCTGIFASCTAYTACSTTCGPGTQSRACYDTGCGSEQVQTQDCMINDPTVWGTPTTCTVKCGGGTQDHTNQCGTTETIACNTSACPAWTKLKDSSFISIHPLTDMLASVPVAYDADDTNQKFFIVGADGVVAAPEISLDISNVTSTAKTGDPEYKVIYTPGNYSLTASSFLSYVKARKEYKVIADLGEISGSGIYVYNGDIAISSNVTPFNQSYKVVLIATGTVTISAAPDNTFSPAGTAAIVAPTINFNGTITEAQGIFIGDTISTGTNAAQGLKVIGNLIAQTTLSNNRKWPTTTRPSVFIKFNQGKYISLLPYLSTASYQWRQIQ